MTAAIDTQTLTKSLAFMLWYLTGMPESIKYDFDMGNQSEADAEIPPRFWRHAQTMMVNFDIRKKP